MKRFTTFFVLMTVLCLSAVISASTTISANSETSESVLFSERTYDVSVVKIKRMSNGMLVKNSLREKGKYNPDENTLTIEGGTYRVEKNHYEDKTRGGYKYVAGDIYFFNF